MIKQTKRTFFFVLLAFSLGFGAVAQAAGIAVIAHPSVKMAGISKSELGKIYLGKSKSLPNGKAVQPIDQSESSAARKHFNKKVLRMSTRQIKSHWSKRMFTGKGKPPKVIVGDDAVKAWVADNPQALGYIDGGSVDASVKVLLIIP